MVSIKMIGIIGTFMVLIALTGVVSADSFLNYGSYGTSFDGNGISLISSLGATSTGTFAKPSDLLYSVSVKGIGNQPSFGDMSAFFKYSSQTPTTKFAYSETASASGLIYDFSKSISVSF